ncbi:MAG: hypothetical protein M3R70_13480 [Actinomycetota bacterium]|nr:hypothetical protein [Actinomycetota bacterium]
MAAAVDLTRLEWEQGHRRFVAESREPGRAAPLLAELEAVTATLRRRIGQSFTLAELVRTYEDADRWARDAVAGIGPAAGWPRRLAMVEDAAFHLYSRAAVDYEP